VTRHTSDSDRGAADASAAWRSRRAWVVLGVTILVALIADLASKSIAFATIADRPVGIHREEVLEAFERTRRLRELEARLDELGDQGPSTAPRTEQRIGEIRAEISRVLDRPGWEDLIPDHQPVVVIPHVLELTLVLNPGAVFGIGAGARVFFIAFTIGAIGFVGWVFARWTRPGDWLAHVSIGMFIGGGLGNLYDRLVFACVRDFLHPLPHATIPFSSGQPLWPWVSNVADALLILGIAGLLIHSWFGSDDQQHAQAAGDDSNEPAEA